MKERQSSVLIVAAAPETHVALRDSLSRDSAARYVILESALQRGQIHAAGRAR